MVRVHTTMPDTEGQPEHIDLRTLKNQYKDRVAQTNPHPPCTKGPIYNQFNSSKRPLLNQSTNDVNKKVI